VAEGGPASGKALRSYARHHVTYRASICRDS